MTRNSLVEDLVNAHLAAQLREVAHEFAAGLGIEHAGGLIQQEIAGLHGQHGGQADDGAHHSCPSFCSIWSLVWMALELSS